MAQFCPAPRIHTTSTHNGETHMAMNGIRLIAADLDGTLLLDGAREVPDEVFDLSLIHI